MEIEPPSEAPTTGVIELQQIEQKSKMKEQIYS